jgi:hypothetical protein
MTPLTHYWCLRLIWLIAPLMGFNLAALGYGLAQPAHRALAGFSDQCTAARQPCWHGIIPGLTPIDKATRIVERLGYTVSLHKTTDFILRYASAEQSPGCVDMYIGYGIAEVRSLVLHCLDADTGDVLVMLGWPRYIVYNPVHGGSLAYDNLSVQGQSAWYSPHERVVSIYLFQLNVAVHQPWRGFMPLWRYCRLEPGYSGCG